MSELVEIAIPVPLRRLFTYSVPEALAPRITLGSRVAVTFANRKIPGIVVRTGASAPPGVTVKPIAGLLDEEPLFGPELLAFLVEAADYYLHPIGDVLRTAAPALSSAAVQALKKSGFLSRAGELKTKGRVRTKTVLAIRFVAGAAPVGRLGPKQREVLAILEARGEVLEPELAKIAKVTRAALGRLAELGLVTLEEREAEIDPFFSSGVERDTPPSLLPGQSEAVDAINLAQRAGTGATFLLHGVTGSGKTEVYLRAIADARARGQGALLLVPEIALTPQLVGRFRARFGDDIAVLHSGLSEKEWTSMWHRLRSGAVTLAVGARSAIFAPISSIGLIVVDEEHDPSYKQEDGFRYNARDLAVLRAHRAGAVCILGSATPSLETFQLAETGKYRRLVLDVRANEQALPPVEIVDLARTGAGPSRDPLLSIILHRALEKCLAAEGQAILFLNRRGFSPSVRCKSCEHVQTCPACSVSLTEHRRAGALRCHYCDYAQPLGTACQKCGSLDLELLGLGTEKLEATLAASFPAARVARLDRDVATGSGVESVLDRVRRREVDILVGTQMVTKGHDLPGVTLVGVLLADQSLCFPDFRAAERTFQLLTQVAGRAGRADKPGTVVLQTFQPHAAAIIAAQQHSFAMFVESELGFRRALGYSPFGKLVAVRVDAPDEGASARAATLLASIAMASEPVRTGRVEVLGPAPAPIARVRSRFRHRFLLKSAERRQVRQVALAVLARIEEGLDHARAFVDIDPVSML